MSDFIDLNRKNWDERAAAHAVSPDYAAENFRTQPDFLSGVIRFDLPRLGDLSGLRGVHLQCHIGTDTISLSRLGARMTGVDFSEASIAIARNLAAESGADIRFVVGTVDDAPRLLDGEKFDLVYTGIGALCWLPSIRDWAATVAALLAPGGRLFLREGHPMLWAIDEENPDDLIVKYPYFERSEPLLWSDPGTYVATDTVFETTETAEWNHGLGEIISALLEHGLILTGFEEHRSVPWEALPGRMRLEESSGEWSLIDHAENLPLSYTLRSQAAAGGSSAPSEPGR